MQQNKMSQLQQLGWNEAWQQKANEIRADHLEPARVIVEHKRLYRVLTEKGILLGEVSGKFRHHAVLREDYPAVGDWVMIDAHFDEEKAVIHHILPRVSAFSRKAAGHTTEEQIVAVNVDTVFLVMALNQDFNVRRIERYLVSAWESGANPVIVLSKADLCDEIEVRQQEVNVVAMGVPIITCSVKEQFGLEQLAYYIGEGVTAAVMGSSGVGKSSIINVLLGEERMLTHGIRAGDDKGKHTTTHRELLLLPGGGVIIDTPGMRELQLWESDEGLQQGFMDIEELAFSCLYRDCRHENEPHCAVIEAIENGNMQKERLNSYRKLQKELAYMERKSNKREQLLEKKKWKKISQYQKKHRY
nr:ribosome small subunit-dependent GTPase A [Jeotgalibacillus soli]